MNIENYITIYGALSLSHLLTQVVFATSERLRVKKRSRAFSFTIVVPVYNEDPVMLDRCLKSITSLRQKNYEVIVIDDMSTNYAELRPIYNKYKKKITFHNLLINRGKRHAQKVGFDEAKGEIVITIDSDTIIGGRSTRNITRQFADPKIGAVTGNVKALNKEKNFLTQLISYRYWNAFNVERAAQSLVGAVMCCSGPYSAYRKSVLDRVKDEYLAQIFLGKKCTFGDDRHLTNLVLKEGYNVRFDEKAVAYTHVPEGLRVYLKQQLRWNKSFYREMLWTFFVVKRKNVYMLYDLLMQLILPFLLTGAIGLMLYQVFTSGIEHLGRYAALLLIISFIRLLYGAARTQDFGFLRFIFYGALHVILLMPIRLVALATLHKNGWGTR